MESFDSETRALIRDINYAWRSKASLSEYARLRDRIIAHRDKLDVQISTLSTVVRLVVRRSPPCEEQGDMSWQEFFALAASLPPEKDEDGDNTISSKGSRKRPQNWNEICRSRNLAIVLALWSSEIVQYYNWDRAGQGQIRVIRTCAVHFPDFEAAFVPRLNQVLLARHCAGILNCRERTLNEAKLQPLKDFDIESLKSTPIDWLLQSLWLTNKDGAIPIDSNGTLLKDIRPQHFQMYLLQRDKYGTFEPRSSSEVCPTDANLITPPITTTDDSISTGFFDIIESSPADKIGPRCPLNTPDLAFTDPTLLSTTSISPAVPINNDFGQLDCTALGDQQLVPQAFPNALYDVDPTLLPNPSRSPSEISAPWTPQSAMDLTCVSTPSIVFQDNYEDPNSFWNQALSQPPSLQCSPGPTSSFLQLDDTEPPLGFTLLDEPSQLSLDQGHSRTRKRQRISSFENSQAVYGNGSGWHGDVVDTHSGQTWGQFSDQSFSKLRVSSIPIQGKRKLAIEEELHNKHLPSLSLYVKNLSTMIESGQRTTQTHWLTPQTQWAKVWSYSDTLGRGWAISEEDAEVIYCTADDLITSAKMGKSFAKPIVIKENFTDSDMHTIGQTLALLQDFNTQPDMAVQLQGASNPAFATDNTELPTPWSPSDTDSCLNKSHFRNMTKSHRPIFTMLSRFRLLETLTDGHQWEAQERIDPSHLNARACTGFNTVSLSGAFSGAHSYTSYGTWTRNLQGTSYFMIVPEKEMGSKWKTFAKQGDQWLPCGKERLVVLEKDDVLLIPPGSRVVHAIHSASDCLTEGGILWDALNIIETLRAMHWACENHFIAHDPLPSDLLVILQRLKQLVYTQPEKFRGNFDSNKFLGIFEKAMQDVQYAIQT